MSAPQRWSALALAALLALFAARLLHVSYAKSFTIDEPNYVATGLYLWRTGDYDWFRTLRLHPPLAFHLASLPLLVLDARGLGERPDAGAALVRNAATPPIRIRVASRFPFVLVSCWGAVLAFLWAREAAGDTAGVLAALLFTFSPSMAAYGPLAHSDILVSVLYLQALYTFWRWWRAPSPRRLVLCGISTGLALAAKASAVLLPFAFAGILSWLLLRPRAGELPLREQPRTAVLGLLGIGVLGLAVLWLTYGGSFRIQAGPPGPFERVPLPGYLRSLLTDSQINWSDHVFWFFGRHHETAPFWVLPAAFVLKTPLPTLLLACAALLRRGAARFRNARLGPFLAVPALLYAAVALFVLQVPYGLRYLLPLVPLLVVAVATRLADVGDRRLRAGIAACVVWLAAVSALAHPHYLAYFNPLMGGSARAHLSFADSNLDWGQDLPALAVWLAERGNPPIRTALFAVERPGAYGIRAAPLRGCEPVERGLVAISAAVFRGVNTPGVFGRPPPDCFDWLGGRRPVAMPGYSILVFDLDAE